MCDQTEVIYSPNDVVWVKLGPVWWPGRVCGEDEIPPEIMKDLRKKPIAIVKFFQEDSFEYVKSLANIYHYHCPRKNEFIKKGLDLLRSKNSGAPSNMKLFPEDVVRAEHLTHGNPAILQSDVFLPEEKPVYTDIFTSNKKTPKKVKSDVKKKPTPVKQNSPRLITHPRFLQLSSGQSTDYEVREREQIPMRAECDVEDSSPLTLYSCTDCDYTTTRLNVIVWHNKSHTRNYASPQASGKATKRKSTSVKFKDSLSVSPKVELKAEDVEGPNAAKIPKTNGTLTVTPSPRKRGRPKGSTSAKKMLAKSTPPTKKTNSTPNSRTPTEKGRRGSVHKGDEIHKSLLEDWLEDEIEQEEPATEENSLAESAEGENKTLVTSSVASNDSNSKSCFDFDDSEDHLVIDETKFTPGRKIPRLLRKSAPSTLAADDVVAMQDSDALEVDATVDSTPQYQRGVEDSMDGDSSLGHGRTSRLQEIGVDNEIEIKTEETHVDEVIKSVPPKKSRRNLKTEKQTNDAAELRDQVDKLLNEISTAPAKLPDIPRSHKKAQLKAYQQQAEAEELAAQKIAAEAADKASAEAEAAQKAADEAEAEAARRAAAEAEAAQKVVAEAAQRAAAEAEAAQRAAAEAEAAQRAAAEAEAAQRAAAEAEAAQRAAAEAEAAQRAAEAVAAQEAAAKAEALQIAAAEAESARREAEARQIAAAEAESARREAELKAAEQKATLEKEAAEKMLAMQRSAEEKEVYNIHPETMDIEVSNIPLPSPRKCPTTSDLFESSISIGANVTVMEDKTSDEQSSVISPSKISSETLAAKNVGIEVSDSNSSAVDQKKAAVASPLHSMQTSASAVSVVEGGSAPAATDSKTPAKLTTACRTKMLNATPVLRGTQHAVKLILPSDYQKLMSKLNASAGQVSPGKTAAQSLNTTKTTSGLLCNLTQPLANSPSSGSPKKILILTNSKKTGIVSTSATTAAAAATTTLTVAGRSISLSNATTVRLTPNILHKSAAAQKAVAALAKTSGKNIVLDASTFQSLFQTQPQQLCKVQPQIVLPEAAATVKPAAPSSVATVAAPSQPGIVYVADSGASAANLNGDCANVVSSSSAAGQTVSYNYIVDSSGNLVQVDEPPTVHTPAKDTDILAKALENTDGLQTEMALSQAATNDMLATVMQTPETAYKTEVIYENLTLNTAPIMSAYETPSRVLATANVLAETAEMALVGSGTTENEG